MSDTNPQSQNGKMDINVNGIIFSGEGGQEWLAKQLEKILATAQEISKHSPVQTVSSGAGKNSADIKPLGTPEDVGTLASHIKLKGGESSQVKRFLAAADWLRRKGDKNLTTAKVSKALADSHQKRLSNAAECLNQNVSKGFCEKNGKEFYITPEGIRDLGYNE